MRAETVAWAFYSGWIALFGTPLTMTTTDQGAQFESSLFTALARLVGADMIHTTPYHPQSNRILERWHRTFKAALMCHPHVPWTKLLPTVLLGLRTTYKENLGTSPSVLLFGTTLRIPGAFFTTQDTIADPLSFVGKLREHFRLMMAVPTAHNVRAKHYIHKHLTTCTHVFRRLDAVKPPLTPPYTGPHCVLRRLDDKSFVIEVDGVAKTLSTEVLKPAYIAQEEKVPHPRVDQPWHQRPPSQPHSQPRQPGDQEEEVDEPSTSSPLPLFQQTEAPPQEVSCPPHTSATRGEYLWSKSLNTNSIILFF